MEKVDRREFLKGLGVAGLAGLSLTLFPWLESCSTAATRETSGEKLRLGIIGPGSRGMLHIRLLLGIENAEITALCDNYKPNLDVAAAKCPDAKLYDDYRRLLEDKNVDAVLIATPLNIHAEMAIAALDAGKHVLCEKAMAYSMEDCLRMYNKAKQTGLVLFVGQQRLFDPKYIRAMEDVRSGNYGPVVNVRNYWFRNGDWRRKVPSPELERHINWRLYREYSRGLMTELACHQLQNGTWSTGMLPEKVMGSGSIIYWKDGREVFDNVSVIYTFPNGVNMTFESVISNKHFGMGEQILCKDATVDLASGRIFPENPQPRGSGIKRLVGEIERGVFNNSVFANTSWAAETGSNDPGTLVLPGSEGDGTREMLMAFCNSGIRGEQPPHVLEEAYYGSIYCLLGDEALLRGEILSLPEELKIDYV